MGIFENDAIHVIAGRLCLRSGGRRGGDASGIRLRPQRSFAVGAPPGSNDPATAFGTSFQ
jgi:hypothetical protein